MLRKLLTAFPVVMVSLSAPDAKAQFITPLEQLNEQQLEVAVNFVLGNASFELFRQATAALIDDLDLPQRNDGSNTVDELSTVMMFELNDIWMDTAIVNATDSWFLGRQSGLKEAFKAPLYTELVPAKRRDQDIACLMIGKDKESYADLAQTMSLDEALWPACVENYPKLVVYWDGLLKGHRSDDTQSDFILTYVGSDTPELADYATMIEESRVFDMIVRSFETFKLKGPIHLVAKSCGRPDVFWSKEDRQITYCYEHAQYQGSLVGAHLIKADAGSEDINAEDATPVKTGTTF